VPAALSNFLRDEIKQRGWTQQRLAELSGLQKSGIHYIINHPNSTPDLETLQKLADGLQISFGRILVICGYDPGIEKPIPESERRAILIEANPDLAPVIDNLVGFSSEERQKIFGYIEAQLEARGKRKRQRA